MCERERKPTEEEIRCEWILDEAREWRWKWKEREEKESAIMVHEMTVIGREQQREIRKSTICSEYAKLDKETKALMER